MTVGSIIKKHREANALTQRELAEMLHISPQAVSKWETNTSLPDITLLVPLARALHVTTDILLGFAEEGKAAI